MVKQRCAIAICGIFAIGGCRTGPPARANSVMPPQGSVKIFPKKVSEGPKKVQWMWTILGDRNWSNSSISPRVVTISGSFPLNSLTRTGGTHVWELWITATTTDASQAATVNLETKIRGSNGAGVTTTASIDRAKLSDAIRPMLKQTNTFRIPADVEIAEVGGKTVKLVIKD